VKIEGRKILDSRRSRYTGIGKGSKTTKWDGGSRSSQGKRGHLNYAKKSKGGGGGKRLRNRRFQLFEKVRLKDKGITGKNREGRGVGRGGGKPKSSEVTARTTRLDQGMGTIANNMKKTSTGPWNGEREQRFRLRSKRFGKSFGHIKKEKESEKELRQDAAGRRLKIKNSYKEEKPERKRTAEGRAAVMNTSQRVQRRVKAPVLKQLRLGLLNSGPHGRVV